MNELPAGATVAEDALSEVLNSIRLRGNNVFRTAVPAGGSLPQSAAPQLHIIESGTSTIGESSAIGGDLVLLPRGMAHTITATTDLVWMTGTITYHSSPAAEQFLKTLPPVISLRFAPEDPREWLEVSRRLLLQEVIDPLPGGSVMVARIIDLLFVQTLRVWARETSQKPGWLKAAMDTQLGPAFTALHRRPGESWTVSTLAATARMSRSTFAERFSKLAGQPPMQYLTERRLDQAAELLRTTALTIQAISSECGYQSEAAFSRAFRKRHGLSPRHWRDVHSPNTQL